MSRMIRLGLSLLRTTREPKNMIRLRPSIFVPIFLNSILPVVVKMLFNMQVWLCVKTLPQLTALRHTKREAQHNPIIEWPEVSLSLPIQTYLISPLGSLILSLPLTGASRVKTRMAPG